MLRLAGTIIEVVTPENTCKDILKLGISEVDSDTLPCTLREGELIARQAWI